MLSRLIVSVVIMMLLCSRLLAAPKVEVLDACFIPDTPFPQYSQFWLQRPGREHA